MLMTRRPYKTIVGRYRRPTKVKNIAIQEIRIANILGNMMHPSVMTNVCIL